MNSKRLAARYRSEGPLWEADRARLKTAGFPPQMSQNAPPFGGDGGGKRNIPKDHPYDAKSLKPLAKALWAASVAMGHALTSYRYLSRIKSATISPDGMLGGRGYVMDVKDIRKKLYEACESLSSITDTLHDEIMAPHWKPRLAQLDENDAEDVERFVEESQEILENPEEEVEEEAREIEEENDKDKEEEPASELPQLKMANSSLPVETLPGGPRIEHLDREDGTPNPSEAWPNDDWGQPSQQEYEYPSEWDNDLREAESVTPSDDTPIEAWDFGLGYGAHGQGAGGYENPSGEGAGTKGVWGPSSALPGTTPSSSGDTTPALDSASGDHFSHDTLPGDLDIPVARSDYYRGDRGNLVVTQSGLPGEATPSGELSPSLMNVDYTHEDTETPYVRYDYTTHDYRDDPLHEWPQSHRDV